MGCPHIWLGDCLRFVGAEQRHMRIYRDSKGVHRNSTWVDKDIEI